MTAVAAVAVASASSLSRSRGTVQRTVCSVLNGPNKPCTEEFHHTLCCSSKRCTVARPLTHGGRKSHGPPKPSNMNPRMCAAGCLSIQKLINSCASRLGTINNERCGASLGAAQPVSA